MSQIEKSNTLSAMFAAVKTAGAGILKPSGVGTDPVTGSASASKVAAFKATLTNNTAGLPFWAYLLASLAAVGAGAYFFIIKKKRGARRRRR
jgi:hypothetical protein